MNYPKKYNAILQSELDGSTFETHRQFLYYLKKLKITEKEYYDKFLNNGDGKCNTCGNSTQFINISRGYKKFCSHSCAINNPDVSEKRSKNAKSALFKKYGVINPGQMKDHRTKLETTCLLKYGDPHYVNVEKTRQTMHKRYGSSYVATPEYRKKYKKTVIKKYGCEHHTQSEIIKNKSKKTCLKKYGVDHPMKNTDIHQSMINTQEEKYGGILHGSSVIHNKIINTNLKKYGYENPTQNSKVANKIKETWLKNSINKLTPIFDNLNVELIDDYTGSKNRLSYKCKRCNYLFTTKYYKSYPPECPKCNNHANTSKSEREIRDYLIELKCQVEERIKIGNSRLEMDLYLPEYKIGIEFNGLRWHSELSGKKSRQYHLNKTKIAEKEKIHFIQIFEDEWIMKKDILKSKIKNLIGKSDIKIYARQCKIKSISSKEARNFYDRTHLQGFIGAKFHIGCYYQDKLVSAMSFGSQRINLGTSKDNKNNAVLELYRYSSELFYNVVGAFSKMLKWSILKYNIKNIITYADRRYSSSLNNVYVHSGFIKVKETSPNYFYICKGIRENRFIYRKDQLHNKIPDIYNPILSEWENMKLAGIDRIWDCGAIKYEYIRK